MGVPVDVLRRETDCVGLRCAGVPEQLVEVVALGVLLAGHDGLVLGR